jgi:hypothetical protein
MIVWIIYLSYLLISLLVCRLRRIINSESEFFPGMKNPWQFDHKNLADRLHKTLPQENGMKGCKVVSSFFPQLFDVHALMYDLQNWFIWHIFLSATVITNSLILTIFVCGLQCLYLTVVTGFCL